MKENSMRTHKYNISQFFIHHMEINIYSSSKESLRRQ